MFRLLPKDEKYFALFAQMQECVQRSVEVLAQKQGSEGTARVRDLRDACDSVGDAIIEKLYGSFITPIDREDLYALQQALRGMMQAVEEASMQPVQGETIILVRTINGHIASALQHLSKSTSAQAECREIRNVAKDALRNGSGDGHPLLRAALHTSVVLETIILKHS